MKVFKMIAIFIAGVMTGVLGAGMETNGRNEVFVQTAYYSDSKKVNLGESNAHYYSRESLFDSMYTYPVDLCMLGDSLTENCQWSEFFEEYAVENRGIGSDTTEGVLARIDSVLKTKPEKIFLMIGINDIAQQTQTESILSNVNEIIDIVRRELPDTQLYVESILPVGRQRGIESEHIDEVNAGLRELCGEKLNDYGGGYLDLYPLFADQSGYLKQELQMDPVHINSHGYEIWIKELRKIIGENKR